MTEISLLNQEYSTAMTELEAMITTSENAVYTINFQSRYENSKIIRDFVGKLFDAFSIHHPWRGRFILITDELINNAIEHGSSNEHDMNQCIIAAGNQYEGGHFHISLEVHDSGNGAGEKIGHEQMNEIKDDRTKTENNAVYMKKRGRGLFHITEKIVDRLSFSESKQ